MLKPRLSSQGGSSPSCAKASAGKPGPKSVKRYKKGNFKPDKVFENYVMGWKETVLLRKKNLNNLYREMLAGLKESIKIFRAYPLVRRVVLFGSFLDPDFFDGRSDIDLAYLGEITGKEYFFILNTLENLFSREVNLVDLKTCDKKLKENVEKTGKIIYRKGD